MSVSGTLGEREATTHVTGPRRAPVHKRQAEKREGAPGRGSPISGWPGRAEEKTEAGTDQLKRGGAIHFCVSISFLRPRASTLKQAAFPVCGVRAARRTGGGVAHWGGKGGGQAQ